MENASKETWRAEVSAVRLPSTSRFSAHTIIISNIALFQATRDKQVQQSTLGNTGKEHPQTNILENKPKQNTATFMVL